MDLPNQERSRLSDIFWTLVSGGSGRIVGPLLLTEGSKTVRQCSVCRLDQGVDSNWCSCPILKHQCSLRHLCRSSCDLSLGVLSRASRIREIYFGIPQISVQSIDRKISIEKLETRVGQSL